MRVIASILNVRSGPGTEFRVLDKLPQGATVDVKELHGDWAWVGPAEGWVSRMFLENLPTRLVVPAGHAGIRQLFGEPGSAAASSGRVTFPAPLKLGWMPGSVTRASCHALMEAVFTEVFEAIHAAGLWSSIRTYDGIYNDRVTTSGTKKSTHAWGIAVDLNASTNRFGTRGDMDPRLIRVFEQHGFVHLKRDPMHFQYASGY